MKKLFLLLFFSIIIFCVNISPQTKWEKINGFWDLSGRITAFTINTNGDIIAATAKKGVLILKNNTEVWDSLDNGLNKTEVRCLATDSNGNIYAGTLGKGVFKLKQNSNIWEEINNGSGFKRIYDIAVSSAGEIFALTKKDIIRSTDKGLSWTEVTNEMNNTYVSAIAFDSAGVIYLGTEGKGVYKSIDNGNSWIPANKGIEKLYLFTIAVNSKGEIFAGTEEEGVFRSTDKGESWELEVTRMERRTIYSLAINKNGEIAAASRGDLFISDKNGEWWKLIDTGLNESYQNYRQIIYSPDGHIYVRSSGNIYRSGNKLKFKPNFW